MDRPQQYRFYQGEKQLPFSYDEYDARLAGLRATMREQGIDACAFTSMHNIAYYSGFLYCSFGRPYGLVVTPTDSVTISAGIDAAQPWRRCHGDNITYTDWQRNNYWRAIKSVTGTGKTIGYEADHLSLAQKSLLDAFLSPARAIDIAGETMRQRMHKSPAELDLIRHGAAVADVGGYAIREAICEGTREIDVAMAGRNAMELEIAKRFPDAEYRDTWVWFQSGINTDGAHNPVTSRRLRGGDILSLNTFPMISGYYTALERTLFVGEVDDTSLAIWNANVAAHEYGISLLKPGIVLCRSHPPNQRLFRRSRIIAIPHLWVRPFVWGAKPLLWTRGGIGTTRRYRHCFRARHGDFYGTHADHSRGPSGRRGISRTRHSHHHRRRQ
jgi:creatinase